VVKRLVIKLLKLVGENVVVINDNGVGVGVVEI
jgi:hypothetical protein